MPTFVASRRELLAFLLLAWLLIQAAAGSWIVYSLRENYLNDVTSFDQYAATVAKQAYVSVLLGQFIQPIVSSLLLFRIRKKSASVERHIAKAIGFGILAGIATGLIVCAIFEFYPPYPHPPTYFDLTGVFVAGIYFIFPIFPLASAVVGGVVCGLIHWKALGTLAAV